VSTREPLILCDYKCVCGRRYGDKNILTKTAISEILVLVGTFFAPHAMMKTKYNHTNWWHVTFFENEFCDG